MCRHIYDWNIVNCDVKQPIYFTLPWIWADCRRGPEAERDWTPTQFWTHFLTADLGMQVPQRLNQGLPPPIQGWGHKEVWYTYWHAKWIGGDNPWLWRCSTCKPKAAVRKRVLNGVGVQSRSVPGPLWQSAQIQGWSHKGVWYTYSHAKWIGGDNPWLWRLVQWWFVNPGTFVPGRYFRINEFSGLLKRPSVQKRTSVPALFSG